MPDITGRHIVDTTWLAQNLGDADLVVLDCSWYLPAEKRNPKTEYAAAHIPGARFFDIDAISDRTSPLPHMLASPEQFAQSMKELGVGSSDSVVVYDGSTLGLMSAARVWWNFRIMEHDNVAVLDGGLKKWKAEGRTLTSEPPPARSPGAFAPQIRTNMVRGLEDMRRAMDTGRDQIVDARSARRFAGLDPEPRPGLRSGHIPGARNLPFNTLLTADGTLNRSSELRRAFETAGIDLDKPIVTSCGSGVSAAVLSLALALIGRDDVGLYDGSWSEWGQEKLGLPIASDV